MGITKQDFDTIRKADGVEAALDFVCAAYEGQSDLPVSSDVDWDRYSHEDAKRYEGKKFARECLNIAFSSRVNLYPWQVREQAILGSEDLQALAEDARVMNNVLTGSLPVRSV